MLRLPAHPMLPLRRRPAYALAILAVIVLGGLAAVGGGRQLYGWYHARAARQALQRQEPEQAWEHVQASLRVWPEDGDTHLLAARAAWRSGRRQEAGRHLDEAQRLLGATEATTLEWSLLRALDGASPDVADYLRLQLREDHPDRLAIVEALTSWQWMQGHLAEAKQYLDRWLEAEPGNREVLVRRGWVHERLFDRRAALQDYQAALDLDPGQDRVRLQIAEILLQTERAEEAARHFEQLHERQPDTPAVVLGLARCRHLAGQSDEARRLLDALLAEHPRYPQALSERGKVALQTEDPTAAEPWLRRALEHGPRDRELLSLLVQCLRQVGRVSEADDYARQLRRLDDDLRRMGQHMQDVLRAPRDPAPRHAVGAIFLRNGFTDDGLRWLESALQYDAGHRPTHRVLAAYYEGKGEAERAALHRQLGGQSEDEEARP